nr:hypothetical protein CFP56_64894 [Quercus suber]
MNERMIQRERKRQSRQAVGEDKISRLGTSQGEPDWITKRIGMMADRRSRNPDKCAKRARKNGVHYVVMLP